MASLGIIPYILIALIILIVAYVKTKSYVKTISVAEILIALMVFVISMEFVDRTLIYAMGLISLGLLINGIKGFLKK